MVGSINWTSAPDSPVTIRDPRVVAFPYPLGDTDQRLVTCSGYASFDFSFKGTHEDHVDAIIRFPIMDSNSTPLIVTNYAPTKSVPWGFPYPYIGTVIVAPASLDEWDSKMLRFYTDNPILAYTGTPADQIWINFQAGISGGSRLAEIAYQVTFLLAKWQPM